MHNKHKRTLEASFADPAPASIQWAARVSLFVAMGCNVIEGAGSRVRFECQGLIATFHRPHPQKEAKRYQIRDARDFLIKLGFGP